MDLESPAPKLSCRPELVFGLVGAIGTDLDIVCHDLVRSLGSVGYSGEIVRISELLRQLEPGKSSDMSTMPARQQLMQYGDNLRVAASDGAAAAILAIKRIAAARQGSVERHNVASIVRSLKHPDEVAAFREVYGSRFVLIGASSPAHVRQETIRREVRLAYSTDEDEVDRATRRLMERDEEDRTESVTAGGRKRAFGQGVRKVFEEADVYIPVSPRCDTNPTRRFIDLLFGRPFETPNRDEQAMFHAAGARLRSSASGRQVGCVVVDGDGEVLVTGTNEVPRAGGGQYWAGHEEGPDHRDFRFGYDINDQQKLSIVTDIMGRLKSNGWLSEQHRDLDPATLGFRALESDGPLDGSRVSDLLEFGRIVHAEMAAICTAARRGTPLRDGVMYSTTFPCHECARLIVAVGISKVVYIDPYPKSQVRSLFKDQISEDVRSIPGTLALVPFEGVSPSLFAELFSMTGRARHPVTGEYENWSASESWPKLVIDRTPTFGQREDRRIEGLRPIFDRFATPRKRGSDSTGGPVSLVRHDSSVPHDRS